MPISKEDIKYLEQIDKLEPSANCLRAKIAALIVKDGKVIVEHCNDWHPEYNCAKIKCIRDVKKIPSGSQREVCYGLCAEQWCIAIAAKKGIKLEGTTMYCTKYPCRVCESLIAESGIKRVIYQEGYFDVMPEFDILGERGVIVEQGPNTPFKDPETSKSFSI